MKTFFAIIAVTSLVACGLAEPLGKKKCRVDWYNSSDRKCTGDIVISTEADMKCHNLMIAGTVESAFQLEPLNDHQLEVHLWNRYGCGGSYAGEIEFELNECNKDLGRFTLVDGVETTAYIPVCE